MSVAEASNKNNYFQARQFIITSELLLWRSVIVRNILDSLGMDIHAGGSSRIKIVKDAKAWLNKNDSDFNEVCDYANLQPYFVIKMYGKIVEGNDKKLYENKNLHKFLLEYLCTFTEEQ
mgnify:CR=1 FL=1|tara:strand:- start:2066 stop:2422 length:357 start_codon:yes stop_codon:yes gene_type:complete